MIIDHNHPLYRKKRNELNKNKFNGAYYYSKDIVKHIIPNVKTDRNWITVRIPELEHPEHSIVFIHNNRNPNYYKYLKKYNDILLICSTPRTYENMKFFGNPILLPLSVDVKQVERYKSKIKDKTVAFAGRSIKVNNKIPDNTDKLCDMPRYKLLKEISRYQELYAVGRTAIEGKILGCKILPYDNLYPDPEFWQVVDCKEAAEMLQQILNTIDN